MLTKIRSAFSSPPATTPPRIKASDVTRLEHLAGLLDDTTSSEDAQVRLSRGHWKLKESSVLQGSGFSGARARAHQRAAIEQNALLFTRALSQRRCTALAPGLLLRLRGCDDAPLSKGQLRAQLRALKWIDIALREGLGGERACELVRALFDRPEHCGVDADVVVRMAARLMRSSPGLMAEAALATVVDPPCSDEFPNVSVATFRELGAVQALLERYLSPSPSAPAGSLESLLGTIAPSDPEERRDFAIQLSLHLSRALPLYLPEARLPDIQPRLNELALVLAGYLTPPAAGDAASSDADRFPFVRMACLSMARRFSLQAAPQVMLQLMTTVLLDGERFAHAHAKCLGRPARLLEFDSREQASDLWRASAELPAAQLSVLGRALALDDPHGLFDRFARTGLSGAAWTQLAYVHAFERFPPARSVLMVGCLVAACTGRDPVLRSVAPWRTSTHANLIASLKHHLQGFEPGQRERLGKLFALGVQMVEDPLCVFGPPAASAATDAPLFTEAEALELLTDFYQIEGLFAADPKDAYSVESHLEAIRSDARLPTDELRVQLAARLLQQPSRADCFAALLEPAWRELEAAAKNRAVTARDLVHRVGAVWDSSVAVAAAFQSFPATRSFVDLTKRILDNWRALNVVLDTRVGDGVPLGMPPHALAKQRMELATSELYGLLPAAFGLPVAADPGARDSATVAFHTSRLRALQREIQELNRLWRSERIDSKSDSTPGPEPIPLQALQRIEALLPRAEAMTAPSLAAPPRDTDSKPAPGSRKPPPLRPPGQS